MRNVPVTGKVFQEDDKQAMIAAINSGEEIAHGSYLVEFERKMAEYVGKNYAWLVNSGSSANLLAFMALTSPSLSPYNIRRGDEVIVVAASFPTTIAPIVQFGAIPVFVDITIPEYNIDVSKLEEAYSLNTRAVFIAHTLGNPFDIDAVREFCNSHNLWLISDDCDALGSKYRGVHTNSYGDISTASFYPAHHMTTGQGGMVFTNNYLLSKIIRSMRGWGKDCVCPPNKDNVCNRRFDKKYGTLPTGYDHKYVFSEFGYNLGSTNFQAALGLSQLKKLPAFTEQRHKNFAYLHYCLRNMGLSITLPKSLPEANPSWFMFPLLFEPGKRERINKYLNAHGVQTRPLFCGNILRQPLFTDSEVPYRVVGSLDNTDRVMNDLLCVGIWHGLNEGDMRYIAETIRGAMDEAT
jgi:CDP-6-deoxy-D-xylo-4-hexulose-3-dehydrase